jgi:hypothetical protein
MVTQAGVTAIQHTTAVAFKTLIDHQTTVLEVSVIMWRDEVDVDKDIICTADI